MLRNFIMILITIFFSSTFLFSQDLLKCDSLLRIIQKPLNDSSRVDAYADICWEYKDNHPNKAFNYGDSGLQLAIKIRYVLGQATCLKNIGLIHYHEGNYVKSIMYQQDALKLFEKIQYKRGISACFNNLGLIYYAQSNLKLAEQYFKESLKILTDLIENDTDKNTNQPFIIAKGHALNNLGMVSYARHDHERAREYFNRALDFYKKAGLEKGFASVYDQLGKDYEGENSKIAITYYLKALDISKKIGDKSGICDVLADISFHFISVKDYKSAIEYSNKNLQIAASIQYLESQRLAYKNLSITYDSLNENKKAFLNFKLFKLISDSLFSIEKQKQASYLEILLESERKQNEIVLLNADKKLKDTEIIRQRAQKNALMIAAIFILALAFVIFWNYFRIRKALTLVEEQKKKIEENNFKLNEQASLIHLQKVELELKNKILSDHEYELQAKNDELNSQNEELQATMDDLRNAQAQLIESEKMASLGVLSAGIAHEINNPVNFISSGVEGLKAVLEELWMQISQKNQGDHADDSKAEPSYHQINKRHEALEKLQKDYSVIIANIDEGITRTVNVIKSLLMFTRAEQNVLKFVNNIHENIDSTLSFLPINIKTESL